MAQEPSPAAPSPEPVRAAAESPPEEGAANDVGVFKAGAAKLDITPAAGVPLNGYGDRMGRDATGSHDPLWVRVLCLDDGETRVLLVNADLCVITPELRSRVLELAPPDVPRENVILTATHTHNGPGGMSRGLVFRMVSGRYVPELVEQTAKKFADAMRAACDARKPATIGYATARQDVLSRNRRHDGGPIDDQIGVIRVNDADGRIMAVVANLAAHPTMVGDDDRYSFSADYPGVYYREMESMTDEGCVALFLNGAEGNQTASTPEKVEGWERIESVGRLLAVRVKETANDLICGDATLRVGYATPELPPHIGQSLMPQSTVIQTLEINDLLLTFVPGEPCVEIGLELRRQAVDRGYGAQFTVGLANDYIGYFIPQEFYSHPHYESAMNFYGPRIAEWFYAQFGKLMTRGEAAAPAAETPPDAPAEEVAGARKLVLSGTPYAIGYARGKAFADEIRKAWQEKIVAPVADRTAIPTDTGLWQYAPAFLDLTPLALPRLAIGARPLLAGVSEDAFREIEGMADAVGLPFDAVWLLQCAPALAEPANVPAFYRAPFCTMFAVAGPRAGAGGLVAGRNLDWTGDEAPVVLEYIPESGRRFIQVGFPWNAGVFTGMNDAGVVVCAERVEGLGRTSADGAPVEFVLRAVLQEAEGLDDAVAALRKASHLRGYHVLVASGDDTDARVVEFGREIVVREPKRGLVLGANPESEILDDAARARYARASALIEPDAVDFTKAALVLRDRSAEGDSAILNGRTRHSVIFEPRLNRLRVAFPAADGSFGEYTTVTFSKEGA